MFFLAKLWFNFFATGNVRSQSLHEVSVLSGYVSVCVSTAIAWLVSGSC